MPRQPMELKKVRLERFDPRFDSINLILYIIGIQVDLG